MSEPAKTLPRMTVDEFLDWSENREGRYELYDGEVFTMQSERIVHVIVKGNVFKAFDASVRSMQSGCIVLQDGATVRIDRHTTFEPDCTVHCGPIDIQKVSADNPIVVVEVISRSSQAVDLIRKLSKYFKVASIQHYLIIDPDKRTAIHHRRNGDEIAVRILGNGSLTLEPPGITIQVDDFFADLPQGDEDA